MDGVGSGALPTERTAVLASQGGELARLGFGIHMSTVRLSRCSPGGGEGRLA